MKIGDIVRPKSEWLDEGEIAKPAVVLNLWEDNWLHRTKISVINADEAEKIANGTLIGFPHSRMDSFAEYYEVVNE